MTDREDRGEDFSRQLQGWEKDNLRVQLSDLIETAVVHSKCPVVPAKTVSGLSDRD